MPELLQNPLTDGPSIAWDALLIRLMLALVLGGVVACIYHWTQRPEVPVAPSFVATLVLLCILIALVTQVIGNNIARAFSLAGALAIIRFRTVVEDTRDTAFVIFAVIVGMALGADNGKALWTDNLVVAGIGLGVVGLAATVLRWLPWSAAQVESAWTLQLRIAAGFSGEAPWEAVFARHCEQAQLVSTATARQGVALDFTYKLHLKTASTPMLLLGELNRLEGIQNLELRRT